MTSAIHIIIVTYNGSIWIDNCLDSIHKSSMKAKVWVLDNCSTDDTLEKVARHPQEVDVRLMDTNLGFGKANNEGISRAIKEGADYLLLLNQDAYLHEETLAQLLEASQQEASDYSVLSPVHLDGAGECLDSNFGKFYATYSASPKLLTDALTGQLNGIYMLPFINAAAWFIPKRTFEVVGGFDPLFPHYGEDDNFCQRLRFHGLTLGLVTGCYVRHDRAERKSVKPDPFSDEELKIFRRRLKVRYANPNNQRFPAKYDQEQADFKSWALRNRLKFNSTLSKGYSAKARIMAEERDAIVKSRNKVIEASSHYLNL